MLQFPKFQDLQPMLPRRAWNFFVKFFDTFFREKILYFKIIKNIEKYF